MKSGACVFLWGGAGAVAVLAASFHWLPSEQSEAQAKSPVPVATPLGITLQLTNWSERRRGAAQQVFYADAAGMTLYAYSKETEAGKPACVGDCAQAWPPAVVGAVAISNGDWSLIRRPEGTTQWAYRGEPLHKFAGDKAPGDLNGDGADDGAWHVAVFRPGAGMILPVDISVREISDAGGAGLVDLQGMTLYVFDGEATHPKPSCGRVHCDGRWLQFEAPTIANPTGDFSVIVRDDGIAQWTYRGKPLYRFDGDQIVGDATGTVVDARFQVALIVRYFMPADATIRPTEEIHDVRNILATSGGATLYHHDRVIPGESTGFRADHGSPALGRSIGTASCDESCAKTWRPFIAPGHALPTGYWDIATRSDGTRQWVYQGFALYTYAEDRPGDISGNETYELGRIGEEPIIPAGPGMGITAMVWHAVLP